MTTEAKSHKRNQRPSVLRKGYDFVQTMPGTVDSMDCRVCGSRMNVERNVLGPTNAFDGMAGYRHYRDYFVCPHADEDWHQHATALAIESDAFASRSLRAMVAAELQDFVAKHLDP